MRILTEKKYHAIHEGYALKVNGLESDLDIARSEREYYREDREAEKNARQFSEKVYLLTIEQTINERDEARADVEKLNYLIDKWMEATFTAREQRDEALAEVEKLKAAYSVRPMGLGEFLVSELERVSKISADYNAEQADATTTWEPSDCISGVPGCFCDRESAGIDDDEEVA